MQRLAKLHIGQITIVRKNQDSLCWIKFEGIEKVVGRLTDGGAQAAIISSILYSPRFDRNLGVRELKSGLVEHGVPLRPYLEAS